MAMRGKQPSGIITQKKMLKAAVGMFLEKGIEFPENQRRKKS